MRKYVRALINNKYFDYLLLILFCLFLVITNIIWLKIDVIPPHWDEARHLWTSLHYYDLFHQFVSHEVGYQAGIETLIKQYFYYPPLIYYLTLPFYFIFGMSADVAKQVNIIFIFMLVFSVYGIGKHLWNRETGILSSLFIATSPMILSFFREYQLDMPLTAFVALAFYLLLKSNNFQNRLYSIMFGIICGLGMMEKWTFPIFIIGPILYSIILLIWNKIYLQKPLFKNIINGLISLLLFSAFIYFWYFSNHNQLQIDFKANGLIATPEKGFWYNHMVNIHTYLIYFVFIVAGLAISFTKLDYLKKNFLLICSIFSIFFISSVFIKNSDARYTLPWLVFAAILATFWISQTKNKLLHVLACCVFITILIFNFISVTYGFDFLPQRKTMSFNKKEIVIYNQRGYTSGHADTRNWRVQEILADINNDAEHQNFNRPAVFVTLIDDNMNFNNWDFDYYLTLDFNKYNLKFKGSDKIYSADYLITRFDNGDDKLNSVLENKIIKYDIIPIKTYDLPNKTKSVLYRVNLRNTSWIMDLNNKNFETNLQILDSAKDKYLFSPQSNTGLIVWGPYQPFNAGNYQLSVQAKSSKPENISKIARIEVYSHQSETKKYLGLWEISSNDIVDFDEWQEFKYNFYKPNDLEAIEFRIFSEGVSDLSIKDLKVTDTKR